MGSTKSDLDDYYKSWIALNVKWVGTSVEFNLRSRLELVNRAPRKHICNRECLHQTRYVTTLSYTAYVSSAVISSVLCCDVSDDYLYQSHFVFLRRFWNRRETRAKRWMNIQQKKMTKVIDQFHGKTLVWTDFRPILPWKCLKFYILRDFISCIFTNEMLAVCILKICSVNQQS